jgi:soluble lytic murein transglycosylase-like protein
VFAMTSKLNKLTVTLGAGALLLGSATQAAGSATSPDARGAANRAGMQFLDRPGARFERSVAVAAYDTAFQKARRAGVAPREDLAKVSGVTVEKLRAETRKLKKSAAAKNGTQGGAAYASPESYGVSQSTLDAIAACESGGDPTAVSADGTYRGKYQFDYGTWASVGGSGDPAAAPEAEQDMRAAMLLSRAGTSPWPICG